MSSMGAGSAPSNFEEELSSSKPSNFQETPLSMQTHKDKDDYDEDMDDFPYSKNRDTELPCYFFAPGIFPTTNNVS